MNDPRGSWTIIVKARDTNQNSGASLPVNVTIAKSDLFVDAMVTYNSKGVPAASFSTGDTVYPYFRIKYSGSSGTFLTTGQYVVSVKNPSGATVANLTAVYDANRLLFYALLHGELEAGMPCALLSYDAFPEDVQARMGEFGWDIISHLRKGRLKIIDCYSGLAGQGEGALRDPSDLTELNIQVTSFITKAKNVPVTLILDSLTPIFNGVEAKQAINFLQTVGAKVKKSGGLFILTASRGAIPEDSVSKIRSIVDGVIDLTLVRSGRKAVRYLSVLKMERRRIASDTVLFEIERERGLVFRVSRFRILRRKLGQLKLKPTTIPAKGDQAAATSPKVEGRRVDEKGKEGRGPEVSSKDTVTKQR